MMKHALSRMVMVLCIAVFAAGSAQAECKNWTGQGTAEYYVIKHSWANTLAFVEVFVTNPISNSGSMDVDVRVEHLAAVPGFCLTTSGGYMQVHGPGALYDSCKKSVAPGETVIASVNVQPLTRGQVHVLVTGNTANDKPPLVAATGEYLQLIDSHSANTQFAESWYAHLEPHCE